MYGFGGLQNGANKTKILLVAAIVLIVVVAGGVGLMLLQKKDSPKSSTSKKGDAATSARIINKVSELYDVPTGEEPTVAAIQDRSKLDGQEFFDKAKNGDYLLVYTKAKLALLYREGTDKLINVGPVNMQDTEKQGSDTSTDQPTTP